MSRRKSPESAINDQPNAIEVFGFDRVMFGGDWPVMELATRYPAWVAMVDRITAGTSPTDLR